ncbi:hypothetical protein AAG906_035722 [Vitis piasezkii]
MTFSQIVVAKDDLGHATSEYLAVDHMLRMRLLPTIATFTTLMHRFYRDAKIAEALKLKGVMELCGLKLDVVAYNVLTMGMCANRDSAAAFELYEEMIHRDLCPNITTYVVLVDAISTEIVPLAWCFYPTTTEWTITTVTPWQDLQVQNDLLQSDPHFQDVVLHIIYVIRTTMYRCSGNLVILKHWLLNTTSYWEPGLALKNIGKSTGYLTIEESRSILLVACELLKQQYHSWRIEYLILEMKLSQGFLQEKLCKANTWQRAQHTPDVNSRKVDDVQDYKFRNNLRITGSLFFICDVLDDGDSGPIFKVQTVYPPPHQRPQLRAEDICCTGFQDLVHEVAQ